MHRIVKSHLESFVKSYGYGNISEEAQFERFSNFSLMASKVGSAFDIDEVTTGDGDDGCDGVAIIINEEIVVSDEDAKSIFALGRKNNDVECVFIQAKRSESFDLGDFLKFKESVLRFLSSEEYLVNDEVQKTAKNIFNTVIENVSKLRNGKPSITVRFVTTGTYRSPDPFEVAKRDFKEQLIELGLFEEIDINFLGRDEITLLWVNTYSGISAKIEVFSSASLPKISGIEEAYLVVVKAKDLVSNLLVSEDGSLRTQVFEENVRSFLGGENQVNTQIANTIKSGDSATRFPVLNNGITVVSPDVRVQGTIVNLENFQIVNGCQTSSVLYENRHILDDKIMVTIKIVETSNEDVFSELVRATNSQTKVDETQFLSLRPIIKKAEQYFNTYEGVESRLYLERRDRQYVGRDIAATRIFSVHNAAKSVAAMFCSRPHLAFRYNKQMYQELTETIFSEENKEIVFYTGCLALYRLHLLVSNSVIPQNTRRFKWHILALIREIISGKENPKLNSRQMEQQCNQIISVIGQHGDTSTEVFKKAVEIVNSFEDITDDRLKRQAILQEMLAKI